MSVPHGFGDESEPEGVHPFLYEPIIASGSDEGGTSSSLTLTGKAFI